METMDESSNAYKSGEFEDLFDASERIVMEPAEALAYSDSYLRMKTFRHNLDLVRDESLQAGRAEGLQAGKLAVAKKMLELKTDIDMVCKVTGLSIDEINALK